MTFSVCLPLTLFEGYALLLVHIHKESFHHTIFTEAQGKQLSQKYPNIGYRPLADNQVTVKAVREGNLVYEATYTIDTDGRRITPQHPQAKTAVLLFGCSFTFGEGLNDTQAMAWQLGEMLGENYQVYNLGYSGYGQHNALAIIEHTLPSLHQYEKILSYFVVIHDHALRAAGILGTSLSNGPRYEVQQGKLLRVGDFSSLPPLPWNRKGFTWLEQSSIVKFYKKALAEKFAMGNEEERMNLLRAILITGAEKLHHAYPQSSSSILVWPADNSVWLQDLAPIGEHMLVIDMKKWLPNYDDAVEKYSIPRDGHPNALANKLAAQGLMQLVQRQNQP